MRQAGGFVWKVGGWAGLGWVDTGQPWAHLGEKLIYFKVLATTTTTTPTTTTVLWQVGWGRVGGRKVVCG